MRAERFESAEDLGEDRGFPIADARRIMMSRTHSRTRSLLKFIRDLGKPCRTSRVGSTWAARRPLLLLRKLIDRHTDDIDAVDEVPAAHADGSTHGERPTVGRRYGKLRLAHFQSHYLPDGWLRRVESFGTSSASCPSFWSSAIDIFVGKLFSHRLRRIWSDLLTLQSQLELARPSSDRLTSRGPVAPGRRPLP